MPTAERIRRDVIVVGAGGAGLRAAIAAAEAGCSVALLSKSLLGKAHTVMAEGGIAAALGNVDPADNWQVHFMDTMKGGQFLNDYRVAEIFAKEAPERVLELERWGSAFDRTAEGHIMQRAFGAHTYRRLNHVGDRTGLEMIRTLQDKTVATGGIDVFAEVRLSRLFADANGRVTGGFGYFRSDGRFIVFEGKAIILATGGWGKVYRVTSNSWECTGDGAAMAYELGAELQDMEMVQFHPTGMVWPPGVAGILVTEGVRGEGGVLKNSEGERFMERYDPQKKDLSSRDVVARAIYREVQAGRGTPHGGAWLEIAHIGADNVRKKLPNMYDQFLSLADVDITKDPMEVAPTIHYTMGGVAAEAGRGATNIPGLYAAGEVACGLHGANRLGGNSLSDLLVFGKRTGEAAAEYVRSVSDGATVSDAAIDDEERAVVEPFSRDGGENPYLLHKELQDAMQDQVGIARDAEGLEAGLAKILELKERSKKVSVAGSRVFNPGWHAARDLEFMLTVSEAIARCAIERKESRGGHWRTDFPDQNKELGRVNLITYLENGEMKLKTRPVPEMPPELANMFD